MTKKIDDIYAQTNRFYKKSSIITKASIIKNDNKVQNKIDVEDIAEKIIDKVEDFIDEHTNKNELEKLNSKISNNQKSENNEKKYAPPTYGQAFFPIVSGVMLVTISGISKVLNTKDTTETNQKENTKTENVTVEDFAQNLNNKIDDMTSLLTTGSFLMGIIMFIVGINRLKEAIKG